MSQVMKSCCGSLCLVAGSDKCCVHEIRKIHVYYCRFVGYQRIRRYGCESCNLRSNSLLFYWGPSERKVINEGPNGKVKLKTPKRPQLLPAILKRQCGHYCRNDTNALKCCRCQLPKCELAAQQYCSRRMVRRRLDFCDCCRPTKAEQRTEVASGWRGSSRTRRLARKRKTSQLPLINLSIDEEIEYVGPEGSGYEDDTNTADAPGDRDRVTVPLDPRSYERCGPGFSAADWPTLPAVQDGLEIEMEPAGADTIAPSETWELLSSAGSVWSFDSTVDDNVSTVDDNKPSRSFRDVVLAPAISVPTHTIPTTSATPKTKCALEARGNRNETALSDEEDDFLGALRDAYKSTRGGKPEKRYHRETKGRESFTGFHRSWDDEGRCHLRYKARQATKRLGERLLKATRQGASF